LAGEGAPPPGMWRDWSAVIRDELPTPPPLPPLDDPSSSLYPATMRRHHGHSSVPACDGSQDVLWLAVEWCEKDDWRKVVSLRSKEKGSLARRKMPVILLRTTTAFMRNNSAFNFTNVK
jgi:hypothetical protein